MGNKSVCQCQTCHLATKDDETVSFEVEDGSPGKQGFFIGTQMSILKEEEPDKDPVALEETSTTTLTLDELKCNVVALKLTLSGLQYDQIIGVPGEQEHGVMRIRLERAIREALAKHASGVDASYIHLTWSEGLVVSATVVPVELLNVSLSQVQFGLSRRRVVEASVVAAIKDVKGIEDVTSGGPITCSAGEPFPDEWKEATTEDGRTYYWSVKLRTTNWQDPREAEVERPEKVADAEEITKFTGAPVIVDETEHMVLTFLTADRDVQEKIVTFYVQPIGLDWMPKQMPIRVNEVTRQGAADEMGVKKKWTLCKVNGENVKDGLDYQIAMGKLMGALRKLPNLGDERRTFA
mmetsp:Transcript_44704/g.103347  ORF Transcript_44704/g.103347 Transcript_44704/m.103347 type:complete len:351 (+) Transcript_44704:138-1190(+)